MKQKCIKQQAFPELKKELLYLAAQINQINNLELFVIRKRQAAILKAKIGHLPQQEKHAELELEFLAIENILNQKKTTLLPEIKNALKDLLKNTVTTLVTHKIKDKDSYKENIDKQLAITLSKHIEKYSNLAINHPINISELDLPNSSFLLKQKDCYIHLISRLGLEHCVKALISAEADLSMQNKYGCTVLQLATRNGHTEIAIALIKAEADLNIQDKECIFDKIFHYAWKILKPTKRHSL